MKFEPSLAWKVLDPTPGGVARMRERLVRVNREPPMIWREALLSFSLTLAVCWSVAMPLLARWHETKSVEEAIGAAIQRPDSGPKITAGAALEQPTSLTDTRVFLVATTSDLQDTP
ncbi:hypothetical protein C7S18_00330 [Ahniella affigens]|uniref:Uncharacterized protein n=1 Tax=Ahniella affigens TaxID=2021234 RepID=A0A2P1PLL2_9GAMM|nr:hypothetical protein [Ahniella affigens]AVP95733.1 hypothetical protein C7S18_00330 [Ahniella affigens]